MQAAVQGLVTEQKVVMFADISRKCSMVYARMTGNTLRLTELQSQLGESAYSYNRFWRNLHIWHS